MIPGNILKKHILKAIEIIDKEGFPLKRESKRYKLIFNNKFYPPKYIISLANKIVNNEYLNSELFSGGYETNNFLIRLGFTIYDEENKKYLSKNNIEKNFLLIQRQVKHYNNSHCPECKNTIYEFLRNIYGLIKIEHKFQMPAQISDYKRLYVYKFLKPIYDKLVKYRGYKEFIKSKNLPPCDIYIVEHDFIVEIDETQHFTYARYITLSNYPKELRVKYNISKWKKLCKKINATDKNPQYRDEQRAWYDTIRDFLPLIDKTFQPTLRIYANDFEWCSLNPKNKEDIKLFKKLIGV